MKQKAYIVLANGAVFEGSSFGASGCVTGEAVFTTGMTGYLETLTDPSFYGQIVMHTFPLIGNYGIIPADFESAAVHASGYIVRDPCQSPSNFRSNGDLDSFLKKNGVIGVCGVDTRRLTKIIRESGVMNARLISFGGADDAEAEAELRRLHEDKDALLADIRAYRLCGAVKAVSPSQISFEGSGPRIVLWDFGAKENIMRELLKRGFEVARVPSSARAADILALKPAGVMLSNGPGDPAENTELIAQIGELCKSRIPIFGICLGHQLLALARGAKTEKLKYGHRGANQPVREAGTGRVYISSQNHGYAVVSESLPSCAELLFTNANDGTCEGLRYTDIPAFSVQYHPEAAGGPLDTNFLFDRFIELIKGKTHASES